MIKKISCGAVLALALHLVSFSVNAQCPYSLLDVSIGDSRVDVEQTLASHGLEATKQSRKGTMMGTLGYQTPQAWPPEGVVLTREQQRAISMHERSPDQYPWPEDVPLKPEPQTDVRVELGLGRNSLGPLNFIRVTHNFAERDDAVAPGAWGETEFGLAVKERWESYCGDSGDQCAYREASASTTFNIGLSVDGCYYNMNAGNGQMWERVVPTP